MLCLTVMDFQDEEAGVLIRRKFTRSEIIYFPWDVEAQGKIEASMFVMMLSVVFILGIFFLEGMNGD